jgi:hypothetical protein
MIKKPGVAIPLCSMGLLLLLAGGGLTDDLRLNVYGIGYPPVKAQNKAQALLMAKRAALLDAYGRALSIQSEDRTGLYEEDFYRGLSGFIKGLRIVREEYLNDGGVEIEAAASLKDVIVYGKGEKVDFKKERAETGPARIKGPSRIPIEEWYKIIEKMIRFDSGIATKGEK